jgi:hypothetical protein
VKLLHAGDLKIKDAEETLRNYLKNGLDAYAVT